MISGFSIIIPAHNEEQVIGRTIRSILSNRVESPVQIIVVANGCSDATAERARAMGATGGWSASASADHTGSKLPVAPTDFNFRIEVLELSAGNKTAALNAGDRAAKCFPRAYMDADIELSQNALAAIAGALADPGVHLVAPGVQYIYGGKNPMLGGYYRLWREMPYVRKDLTGRGFYAIDADLRGRFTEFPEVTADDRFIHNLARPQERRVVDECWTKVRLPGSFRELLAVKTRWTYGNLELRQRRPELAENDREGHRGAMHYVARRPWLWPHVPAFVFVYGYAKRQARKKLRRKTAAWARAVRDA